MEALYGFDSGRSKRAIADNRKLAEDLKEDKGFVFAVIFLFYIKKRILIWFSGAFGGRRREAQGYIL